MLHFCSLSVAALSLPAFVEAHTHAVCDMRWFKLQIHHRVLVKSNPAWLLFFQVVYRLSLLVIQHERSQLTFA